jgi:PleD family two-component response regulator
MTILVIDDIKNCELLCKAVKTIDSSIECLALTDPEKGLALLNEGEVSPKLILANLLMPKMDGLQFFYAVKAHASLRSIPIIFISSYIRETDMDFFSRAGIKTIIKERSYARLVTSLQRLLKDLNIMESDMTANAVSPDHAVHYKTSYSQFKIMKFINSFATGN